MAEIEDVMKLLQEAKVLPALELAGRVKDRKGMAVALTEFAGTLDWLKGKSYPAALMLLKAIELYPDYSVARYNLAVVLTDVQVLDENEKLVALAEEEYRKAVELDPSFAAAHYNLALLYYFTGKLDESKKEYAKAVSLDPDESKFKLLGFLLENAVK